MSIKVITSETDSQFPIHVSFNSDKPQRLTTKAAVELYEKLGKHIQKTVKPCGREK